MFGTSTTVMDSMLYELYTRPKMLKPRVLEKERGPRAPQEVLAVGNTSPLIRMSLT